MDTAILEDLGLTQAEIKVYIGALELGATTAGPIIEKTGLQNSVVHMTLHKLVEKGFLSYILKGKIKHYQPTDPKNILNFIDKKRERFEKLLPELLVRQTPAEKQTAEIFQGYKGFRNAYTELLKDAKKGDEYIFFAFYIDNKDELKKIYSFFLELSQERKKRGIVTKGICGRELEPFLEGRDMKEFLLVDFPIPSNMTICGDRIVMNAWEDGNINLLIHSRQLAEVYRKYFYSVWNEGKKGKQAKKPGVKRQRI